VLFGRINRFRIIGVIGVETKYTKELIDRLLTPGIT
jgi:hypothetical protein